MLLNHCRLIKELSGGVETADGAVRLEDGKITEVFAEAFSEADSGAMADSSVTSETVTGSEAVIDCQGKTLLPGLMDTHTHIIGITGYSSELLKSPMKLFMKSAAAAQAYLDYGFTTLRDCGTPLRVANFVRDAFAGGLMTGPRIISGGCIVSPTEIEEMDSIYEMYSWADGADATKKAVRKELAEHADYVKIMASGSAFHKQGIPVQPIITAEELSAAVEIADMKGTYVAAHAHGDGAIRLCVDKGVRTVEHASFIGEETIEAALTREDFYLVPTLSAMYQNPEKTSPDMMFLIDKLKNMLEVSKKCLQKAYEAGLKMGFATDSTVGMDQYEEGIEFRFRKEHCGMSNIDILLQATKVNAEIVEMADCLGEVKKDYIADLILVDGKPDQDISVMYHKPDMVFLAGERVR